MYPVHIDFPDSFETPRLLIRAPRPGDGPSFNAAVRDSWPELRQWLAFAAGDVPSVAESETRMRTAHQSFLARQDLMLLLWLKDTDIIVGSSGLHRIDWQVPRFEIGYWARTNYAGQGYITEAVAGIARFAFDVLGARRLEIRCNRRNERSAAIPRRLGFVHEATLHNNCRHHLTNELGDTLIFARTRPD